MTTATVTAKNPSGNFSVSEAVKTEAGAPAPGNAQITFQGMSGHEVQRGIRRYPVYTITGWIEGATLAAIDSAFDTVNDVLSALAGADDDKIVIAYTGGGTSTITNIEQVGEAKVVRALNFDGAYAKELSFSVRQCR